MQVSVMLRWADAIFFESDFSIPGQWSGDCAAKVQRYGGVLTSEWMDGHADLNEPGGWQISWECWLQNPA